MRTSILRRSAPSRMNISDETVRALKAETIEDSKKVKTLKTKIQNYKEKVRARDTAINQVFKQKKGEQQIKTASKSQIQYYKQQISVLKNTRDSKKAQLDEIEGSDRYWTAGELRSEIICLFQENERLKQTTENELKRKTQQESDVKKLYDQIRDGKMRDDDIYYLKEDISELKQKLEIYKKGKSKQVENEIYSKLSSDLMLYETYKQQITNESEELKKQRDDMLQEAENEDKEINSILVELDELIDSSLEKLVTELQNREEEKQEQLQGTKTRSAKAKTKK